MHDCKAIAAGRWKCNVIGTIMHFLKRSSKVQLLKEIALSVNPL